MRVLYRWVVVAGLLASIAGCEASGEAAPTSSERSGGRVDGPTARRLVQQGALLVDVRTPGEFATGHIDGALNVPVDQVAPRAGELEPTSRPLVLYCRSGNRSAHAASVLAERGFTVYDLGAMSDW